MRMRRRTAHHSTSAMNRRKSRCTVLSAEFLVLSHNSKFRIQKSLSERLYELDEIGAAGHLFAKLFVDGHRALDEGIFVNLIGLHRRGELTHEFFVLPLSLRAGEIPHLPS